MTFTSSHISAMMPRSCVIITMAVPTRSRSSTMRRRICACVVTSSAVVGSSAISSFGSQMRPMAIIARWRRPPESWCG
ncbi:MAG: hypothetical protein BGO06_25160 [Shinella sp. 65-6]|nr:MAG: hypothetical protein BGO06_25160 [Shinella sp. 65-6]